MYGTMNIKFSDAQQAIEIFQYKTPKENFTEQTQPDGTKNHARKSN
jgi:hypothetical protein